MIRERTKVDGRDATVVYLTNRFVPIDKAAADLIKVVFDDGSAPIFGRYISKSSRTPAVLHVYQYKGKKLAQAIIGDVVYQLPVMAQITALKPGDYRIEI